MGRRGGRAARAAIVTAGLVLGLTAATVPSCEPPPKVVENPGRFTGVNGPGSFYEYLGADGGSDPVRSFDAGNPMCDDGIDNDADGLVDGGADPECVGDRDANERLAGGQPYLGTSLPVRIKADGVIVVRPRDVRVQPVEKCLDNGGELWCLNIVPRGEGPVLHGSVTRDRITLPVPMAIHFDAISGYPGLDPRCKVGVTPNVYVAEDYDEATGTATFATGPGNVAPAMTNCGEWTDLLNAVLALPAVASSVLVTTIVDEQGEPLRLR